MKKIVSKIKQLISKFNGHENVRLQESENLPDQFWRNRSLQWHEDGYWLVTPMPTKEELDQYYATTYWQSRGGKRCLVSQRDLNHFLEIKKLYPEKTFSRVLNLGAGHGGISILFYMTGAKVTNIEPSGLDLGLDWECLSNFEEAKGSYDLIYGSHSLEHLIDIKAFFDHAEKIMSPSGIFYFEVPNCHQDNSKSYPGGKLQIPHTYYFTRDFFQKLPYKVTLNKTYSSIDKSLYTQLDDDTGDVIRFSAEI